MVSHKNRSKEYRCSTRWTKLVPRINERRSTLKWLPRELFIADGWIDWSRYGLPWVTGGRDDGFQDAKLF